MRRFLAVAIVLTAAAIVAVSSTGRAQEGWTIDSMDVTYVIDASGSIEVIENIFVDFGTLEKHGIFRDIPVRYEYDDENDRLIPIANVKVTDGTDALPFEEISSGSTLRIKIGDPDVTVSGRQRYRISYTLHDALNPFDDHDEFYWNVTGNDWEAPIVASSGTVNVPSASIQQTACYQGAVGSQEPCDMESGPSTAIFTATRPLGHGEGLTLVVGLEKGAVEVGPPRLVARPDTGLDPVLDAFSLHPAIIAATVLLTIATLAGIIRLWWLEGRDRWYGDMFYLNEGEKGAGRVKPIGARETIVVEYQPPTLTRGGRRLTPAEIGVLLDERADTLDVSATIVDLAVRKHLRITEEKTGGILGLFKDTDYVLERLEGDDTVLLPFERKLRDALFEDGPVVKMSDLKNEFYKDLAKVQEKLYQQVVSEGMFPRSPAKTRTLYRVASGIVEGVGVLLMVGFGIAFGGALLGLPLVLAGMMGMLLAGAMSRRTAAGRVLYRRALGFRQFMVTAETERQRFAEERNIFHEYLPYAIVFGCVDKWAKAFEALGMEPRDPDYYIGATPFRAAAFAETMGTFSSNISTAIASTPGGSGGSGFGGGGGAGGGGGGGGGGSW